MIGRDREMSVLRSTLDSARNGVGRLVLCSGEPGIGKTRLAQEFAGEALATGCTTVWGRCVESTGAPPLWPWWQMLKSLDIELDQSAAGGHEVSAAVRFAFYEEVTAALISASRGRGLLVVIDDIQLADEPSLGVLEHMAAQAPTSGMLILATVRDTEPTGHLQRVIADLYRAPLIELMPLRGFGRAEVREQLGFVGNDGQDEALVSAVLDATGGNPLFVKETAREIAAGAWQPDRPPGTVIDLVRARVDVLEPETRSFVQAAAIVGRQFAVPIVSDATGVSVDDCVRQLDVAMSHGLVEASGDPGEFRFAHSLMRDSVVATLPFAERLLLHRAVALSLESHAMAAGSHSDGDGALDDRASEIAGHWLILAPYGEAELARRWAIRAARVAVRGLAFEDGERLYRRALDVAGGWPDPTIRCEVLLALAQAAHLAGHLDEALSAAREAAESAEDTQRPDLVCEAALVVQPVADQRVNALLTELCDRALAVAGREATDALRARLLARRSNLAHYAGDLESTQHTSLAALDLARRAGDDKALIAALRARYDACPGSAGRGERQRLSDELCSVADRAGDLQASMWGTLWSIDVSLETGRVSDAFDALVALRSIVARVGGPANLWHVDRVSAAVAQAQGREDVARADAQRGYERMVELEPAAANGSFLGLQCGLARHFSVPDDVVEYARSFNRPPPGFVTMAAVAKAYLLLNRGYVDEAAAHFHQAGPPEAWSWPSFFLASGNVMATQVAIGLQRRADIDAARARVERFRGEHVVSSGVHYLGIAELTLGWAALALGDLEPAVRDLTIAVDIADRCGTPTFAAEARHHLAWALLSRGHSGDHEAAHRLATESDRLIRVMGMSAFLERSTALVRRTAMSQPAPLSTRESEVAALIAEGLTNRQVAERLVISERTAGNHVQHILTKLGFTSRSQIVAWSLNQSLNQSLSQSPNHLG